MGLTYQVNITPEDCERITNLLDTYSDAPTYELEANVDELIPTLRSIIEQANKQAD